MEEVKAVPPLAEAVWKNLKTWIQQTNGGKLHDALDLRQPESDYRGVYASKAISKGEMLIRLPASLALDGQKLPEEYKMPKKRRASPWLRCLAAFYRYRANLKEDPKSPSASYNASLPDSYETIWNWTDEEIENYLAGTSSPGGGEWNADPKLVKERYKQQVRPYLEHLKIVLPECSDEEYNKFAYVCQTMSTRCFHLNTEKSQDDAEPLPDVYSGPFFLPAIDLLNHSPDPAQICATLQRSSGFFLMIAQRDIAQDEEILHSYGEHLTSSQCLHTFGFVPTAVSQAAAAQSGSYISAIAPAVLTQQVVLDSCYEVIRSDRPSRLAKYMQDQEMEDEVWDIPSDQAKRDASFLPDVVVIRQQEALPNELITLACLPFLPICAYREAARSLLDPSILDDYYLGKLVCASLLKTLQNKLEMYTPVKYKGNVVAKDDAAFLKELLQEKSLDTAGHRVMYALTVRLEEKESLQALRKEVMNMMARLDESTEETSHGSESKSTEADLTKRQRME